MISSLTIENLISFHEYIKQPIVYGNIEISLEKYINEFKKRFEKTDNDNRFYNIYIGLVDSTYENATLSQLNNLCNAIDVCAECDSVLLRRETIGINYGNYFNYYCNKCAIYISKCNICNRYNSDKYYLSCNKYESFHGDILYKKFVKNNPSTFFFEIEVMQEDDNIDNNFSEILLEKFCKLKNINYSKNDNGNNELFLLINEGNTENLSLIAFNINKEDLLSKNNKNQDIYMYGLTLKLQEEVDYVNMLDIRRHLGLYKSTDINGKTTLMYDIQEGIGIAYILPFNTNQLNNLDNKGDSALMYAINYEDCDNIEEFNNESNELKNWLKNPDDEKVKNELIEYCHTEWDISIGNNYTYILIKLGINMQTINIKGITPLMKANKSKKYNTVCFFLDNGYQVQTVKDYSIVNRLAKKYKESMKPFEKKLLDIFNNILPNNLILYIFLKI